MRAIILTGPKHSGKTSVGKELAALLLCGFVDLDDRIQRESGKSPRALYIEGPEVFKRAEAAALAAALKDIFKSETSNLLVLASGGGLIDNPDALALLEAQTQTVCVFLDVSAKTAWNRISRAELPPFLRTENPEETHRCLHERRSVAYRQRASLVINAEGKTPTEIAQEILAIL